MNKINYEYIVEYIRSLTREEKGLESLREYAEENNIPIIQLEVKQFLKTLIKIKKPKNILEIGTAIAYSAMVMASEIEGKVYTIERNKDMIEIANKNIIENNYDDRIEILEGDASNILKEFDKKIDLVFIDGAKSHYEEFFDYILENLNEEAVIIADNILFKGMIANDDLVNRRNKTIVKRMRSFLEYIMSDNRFETSIIPIGDGVSVSYIRRFNGEKN
ncbi:MAG: O-methyltransferase [Andreesenia angusta]|nr:O-methyltransferase [Andreesenia angusta]